MARILQIAKWLIILLLVLGAAVLTYGVVKINQPFKTAAAEQAFTVTSGQTTKQIAFALEEEGLVHRRWFFEFYIFSKKQGSKIKAGSYRLSPSMSIREIGEILTAGKVVDDKVVFTVIEGWTLFDITKSLQERGVLAANSSINLPPQDFVKEFTFLEGQDGKYASLEGYLFPDTYFFASNSAPADAAKKMLVNFDRKLSEKIRKDISGQDKTIREIIILASIVEKEVGRNLKRGTKLSSDQIEKLKEERRLVASVFYNRLKIGKALESDATVTYITGSKSSRATLEETKIDNPYNTYKYRGLPPGPVSNPSLDSILAAVEPAKTDYLFFLTSADGTAYFAKTLEEHIANRAKYLQ